MQVQITNRASSETTELQVNQPLSARDCHSLPLNIQDGERVEQISGLDAISTCHDGFLSKIKLNIMFISE